jgi:hypothetical protein
VRSKSVPLVVERVEQVIGSLPVTEKVTVAEPLVGPLAARVTVGAVVSITIALFAPRELVAPGAARVKTALFPAASFIVPPLSSRAEADR